MHYNLCVAIFPSQQAVTVCSRSYPAQASRPHRPPLAAEDRHPARDWEMRSSPGGNARPPPWQSPKPRAPGAAHPAEPSPLPNAALTCAFVGTAAPWRRPSRPAASSEHVLTAPLPASDFRSQDPPSWVGRPLVRLTRGGCEVGEGVARKESRTRGVGVARHLARRGAPGKFSAGAWLQVWIRYRRGRSRGTDVRASGRSRWRFPARLFHCVISGLSRFPSSTRMLFLSRTCLPTSLPIAFCWFPLSPHTVSARLTCVLCDAEQPNSSWSD